MNKNSTENGKRNKIIDRIASILKIILRLILSLFYFIRNQIKQYAKFNFITIFVFVLCIYGGYMLISTTNKNREKIIATYGKIELSEQVEGYVFRNEQVVNAESDKTVKQIVSEGERAQKGQKIATYYSSKYSEFEGKIQEIDKQINEAMANRPDILSNDITSIDNQITKIIGASIEETSLNNINSIKSQINNLVQKKAKIAGDLSPAGSYIKQLIEKRSALESQAISETQVIESKMSGIVSYKIDGLEDIFSINKIKQYTLEDIKEYIIDAQNNRRSSEGVRLIDNFESVIAIPYDIKKAENIKEGTKISLRFLDQTVDLIPATIISKKIDENKTLIYIEVKNGTELLSDYREVNFEIVWWQYDGMKVPKQSIERQNEQTYINIVKYGETQKIPIKVLRENENFAIIDNYSFDELAEKAFISKDINIVNIPKITLYDELVIDKINK